MKGSAALEEIARNMTCKETPACMLHMQSYSHIYTLIKDQSSFQYYLCHEKSLLLAEL